jgi:hypothetical protein
MQFKPGYTAEETLLIYFAHQLKSVVKIKDNCYYTGQLVTCIHINAPTPE